METAAMTPVDFVERTKRDPFEWLWREWRGWFFMVVELGWGQEAVIGVQAGDRVVVGRRGREGGNGRIKREKTGKRSKEKIMGLGSRVRTILCWEGVFYIDTPTEAVTTRQQHALASKPAFFSWRLILNFSFILLLFHSYTNRNYCSNLFDLPLENKFEWRRT